MKKESVRVQWETSGDKSRVRKYGELIVGKSSIAAILEYEVITLLCASTPGALGLWLRSKLYPCLLKKCGKNVYFGKNVTLRHPHKIEIGSNVIIDDNCLIDAKGNDNNGVTINDGVFIGRNTILSCKNGDIILEKNVNIGFNCEVFSGSKVSVGNDTHIAAYSYLIGGDHKTDQIDKTITEQGSTSVGISVGSNCLIGAGVKVLDGITVGDNVIMGAGAVVTKNMPESSICAGMPAKVVKNRKK
ncbi:acyltransferase [Verrucomicrobiota bacterium]